MKRSLAPLGVLSGALSALLLTGCVSVGVGEQMTSQLQLALVDATPASAPAAATPGKPLVRALLIQPQPASPFADTLSIAYSRKPGEFATYQLASWTERPVRLLPRLLQRRLEERGVAEAVGVVGDPLRADALLMIAVETLHHDLTTSPSQARLELVARLVDRQTRVQVAQRRFAVAEPVDHDNSSEAAQSMSRAVSQAFDELVPWLEGELQRMRPSGR